MGSRWIKSLLVGISIFILLLAYSYIRGGSLSILLVNKLLASTAVMVGGITLLIGPLAKMYGRAALWMTVRRELGLTAFGFAFLHLIASLLQQDRFPLFAWYVREWPGVLMGLLAIGLWAYMVYLSRNSKIVVMTAGIWKKHLGTAGNIGFIAIFFHVVLLKYESWITWLNGTSTIKVIHPEMPPLNLLIFLFMTSIIIFRIGTSWLGRRAIKHS